MSPVSLAGKMSGQRPRAFLLPNFTPGQRGLGSRGRLNRWRRGTAGRGRGTRLDRLALGGLFARRRLAAHRRLLTRGGLAARGDRGWCRFFHVLVARRPRLERHSARTGQRELTGAV